MTREKDELKAIGNEARLGEASKWLAGSIPVAVAALTFAGLSGDELGRVIRMYPLAFVGGVILLMAAVVAGVVALYHSQRARMWLTVGVVAFALGVGILTITQAAATSKQDRPTVAAGLERDTQGVIAKITVSADGLKPEEYVFVVVQGQNSQRHLDPQSAEFADDQSPIPAGEYSKQRIYSGRIGASPDGHAASTFELPLAEELYEQLVVQAGILTGSPKRNKDDEDAMMFGDPETRAFKCGPETPNISCITVLLPSPPAAQTQM